MVSPQVPFVLHLLLANLAGELPADGVHVEDVLQRNVCRTCGTFCVVEKSRNHMWNVSDTL